jgi:hypothetical protein
MPAGKARMMRISHDYHRGGALAYLAAYDIHRPRSMAGATPRPESNRSPRWSPRS